MAESFGESAVAAAGAGAEGARMSFRSELDATRHTVVDDDWAGGIPAQYGVAPRLRVGRSRWFNLLWLIPIGLLLLIVGIAVAKGIRELPAVQDFLRRYPGASEPLPGTPVGLPAWVGWQHFLNAFFLIFIIRSGVSIIADHPRFYWTRHATPGREWFRVQKPVPANPLYTAKEDSITLPDGVGLPGRRHSIGLARWWHLGIDTLWLANGIVFYVLLFATGRWKRLVPVHWDVVPNAVSVAIRIVQKVGFALIGPAQRLFEHIDSKPGEYTEKDISPYFWHNGKYPDSEKYKRLQATDFADYKLAIGGLVDNPVELSLQQLRALPYHEQITQHFCIQGWSGVAKWGGVSMQAVLDIVEPKANAKWLIFYSFATGPEGGLYYDAQAIEQMSFRLTMLAYDMNGAPVSFGHGAPLRLRNEVELGFKMVKWIQAIEFVEDFSEIGAGLGGYNNDHEFFGYRQSI
jgi:hypothetical protein